MSRPKLEVADIFRRHGVAWRAANKAHLSLAQRRVMTAIEVCRNAALGGHVERCEDCAHTRIAYNSCRNRHCPKCQGPAAQAWMAAREAELLPVPYFHVVFTLPAALGAIAYQNKAKLYGLLFTAAAETLTTIAGDPKHLGADIGVTAVLHTWGQNLQHHPHLHCIVPGGGLSPDGERWIACQNGFFLPVRVLSRLFRRLFLQGLEAMHAADELQFFADLSKLKHANAWRAYLPPLRKSEWVVYAKKPFAGPLQVLAYLARYTHRVAISNSRLLDLDATHVSFRWKDYRENGRQRSKVMASTSASSCAASCSTSSQPASIASVTTACSPTAIAPTSSNSVDGLSMCHRREPRTPTAIAPARPPPTTKPPPCPRCGGRMIVIETFDGPLSPPYHVRKLDGL